MKRAFSGIAAALSLIGGSVAVAADLPTAPVKAPAVATAVYNWTGLYVGANGGWGWGNQDPLILFGNRFDRTSMSMSCGMVGGTVGAQISWAMLSWVSRATWTGCEHRQPQHVAPRHQRPVFASEFPSVMKLWSAST